MPYPLKQNTRDICTHLLGNLVVIRLQGVLTAAEQQLVKSVPAEKGRDLLKQVRTHLIETGRPVMEAIVENATGVKVVTMHHDISTITGEEVILFALARSPDFRDARQNSVSGCVGTIATRQQRYQAGPALVTPTMG